jgi:hypothetical protein
MLQAHSFFWHYLWLAPHVLQLGLALFLWRRGLHKEFPVFFAYLVFEACEEFVLYALDVSPSASAESFWLAFWIGLILEGLIKFALIGEIFARVFRPYPYLGSFGKRMICWAGVALVFVATVAAAYAPIDNPSYRYVSGAHILEQTIYMVECGLILSLFLFAAYFKVAWDNFAFGIALGRGISSSVHLATWAIMASGALMDSRHVLDFVNLAAYHLCVLIWMYYFLVPQKNATKSAVRLPEHDLEVWNRELERLLQQ